MVLANKLIQKVRVELIEKFLKADYEFIGSGWETYPCDGTMSCDVPASASSTTINLIRYNRETEWDDSQTVIIDIDSVTNGTEDDNQQATLTLKKDGEI